MDNQDAQAQVAASVARRGYRDGWTAPQFLARQVAKMAEEMGEMALFIGRTRDVFWEEWLGEPLDNPFWKRWGWQMLAIGAGKSARSAFDGSRIWEETVVNDIDALKAELADLQVVLFNAASAIEEISGQPFSVVDAAVAKAAADEARGKR